MIKGGVLVDLLSQVFFFLLQVDNRTLLPLKHQQSLLQQPLTGPQYLLKRIQDFLFDVFRHAPLLGFVSVVLDVLGKGLGKDVPPVVELLAGVEGVLVLALLLEVGHVGVVVQGFVEVVNLLVGKHLF